MDTEQGQDSTCSRELAILKRPSDTIQDKFAGLKKCCVVNKGRRLLKSKAHRSGVASCLHVPLLPSAQEHLFLSVFPSSEDAAQLAGDLGLMLMYFPSWKRLKIKDLQTLHPSFPLGSVRTQILSSQFL